MSVSAEEPIQTMTEPEPEPVREPEPVPALRQKFKSWENPYVLIVAGICAAVVILAAVIVMQQYREAGPSVTWTLDSAGVMTISGSGEMYN